MNTIKTAVRYHKKQVRKDNFFLKLHILGLYENYEHVQKARKKIFCNQNKNGLAAIIKFPAPLLWWSLLATFFLLSYSIKYFINFTRDFIPSSKPRWIISSIVVTPIIAISSLFLYLSQPADPAILQQLRKYDTMRTARAIRDSNGDLIGAIPNPATVTDKYFNHEQRQGALYVEYVPEVFWDVLVAREDRELDFDYKNTTLLDILSGRKSSYKGINLVALVKRPIESILKGNNIAGGSALINLNIKNLYGAKYFKEKYHSNKLLSKIGRKFEEFRGARHLFPYLAQDNGREFKRMIGMNAPLLVSAGDIYGIRSTSATLFGKRPKDLSEAEQAILAAAYHRNIRFKPLETDEKPKLQVIRTLRWSLLIKKAKKGVENAYQSTNPTKMASIISALDRISTPQTPKVPASLAPLLKNLSFEDRQKYGNLALRTSLFLGGIIPSVNKQLKEVESTLLDTQVITDINLTLPVGKNFQFKKEVDNTFSKILKKCPGCYNKKIGLPLSKNGAMIYIAVANKKGEIVRYYRRGYTQRRPIASISKIPAAVLLTSLGTKAKELFCNKAYKGRKNASGLHKKGVINCNSPEVSGHSYSFFDTIAESKNLPIFNALTESNIIPKEDFLKLYSVFSLQDSKSINGNSTNIKQLAFELAFGVAEGTPELVHKIVHELTQQIYTTGYSQEPHVIKSIRVSEYKDETQLPVAHKIAPLFPSTVKGIRSYLTNKETVQQLKTVLAAPVKSKKGTLHTFINIPNVNFLIAKSGTSETPDGNTRDKWAAGSFKLNNQIYTFTIFVGTDDLETGLGTNVKHKNLMYPIMNEVIKSLR